MTRVADELASFLAGDGRDRAGRTHADVLALDDAGLERHHDFIQWLFPLPEASRAVPGSPVLDTATIGVVRNSPVAQARLAAGAARMGDFYRRTHAWRRPFDHNHLRITRIIKSLRLLCGDGAADDFRTMILERAVMHRSTRPRAGSGTRRKTRADGREGLRGSASRRSRNFQIGRSKQRPFCFLSGVAISP